MCCYVFPSNALQFCLALQPTVFKLEAICRQVYWITPIWPWILQGQKERHICVTSATESSVSICIALRPVVFELQPFETEANVANRFRVRGIFEKRAPKSKTDRHLALWTLVTDTMHLHLAVFYVNLRPAVFELEVFLNDSQTTLTTNGS